MLLKSLRVFCLMAVLLLVRVTADAARPFKGLFVQARDANDQIVGTFTANADLQVIDCLTGTMLHNL
ncbi:hypothetical protein B566_EDAN007592 [Ephemera danica]|nr:hypothetical protein B566_EDAN007592 [Ephemera danica]